MRWVVVGVAALLVGLLAYGVAAEHSRTSVTGNVEVGKTPPGATKQLPVLSRDDTSSIRSYQGRLVLVNFWGSWCTPCTQELPLLQKLQTAIKASGGTVLGVNFHDNTEDATRWVHDKRVTYPSLRDGSGDYTTGTWGVHQAPESYLIGKDGRIKAFIKGPLTQQWIDEHVLPAVQAAR